MTERALAPGNVAAGALFVGGVVLVALPYHVLSILQVMVVAAAVSVGLYALARNVPQSGWLFPFKWLSPFSPDAHRRIRGHRTAALDELGTRMGDRRLPVENAPALPPVILRELRALIAGALDVDPGDAAAVASARDRVSPLTHAILASAPVERTTWFRTLRPHRTQTAAVVHRVMDDLDRIMGSEPQPPASASSLNPTSAS